MAAHSAVAGLWKVDGAVVSALRAGAEPPDPRLAALAAFTRKMVRQRGRVADADVAAFLSAGYAEPQIQEVVLGIGLKTLSNYHNHVADPPLDDAFAPARWERPS